MRMITDEMDVIKCEPNNELLTNREENEAYAFVNLGEEYAVYFPKGGSVDLNLSIGKKSDATAATIRWLNIRKNRWRKKTEIPFSDSLTLTAPTESHWTVLIQVK